MPKVASAIRGAEILTDLGSPNAIDGFEVTSRHELDYAVARGRRAVLRTFLLFGSTTPAAASTT